MQRCGRCKQEKDSAEFSPSKRGQDGHWCRSCYKAHARGEAGTRGTHPPRPCDQCGELYVPRTLKAAAAFCSRRCKDVQRIESGEARDGHLRRKYGISAEDSAAPPTWIGAQCQLHTLNVALKVVVPSTAGDAEVRTAKADVVRALGTDLTFGNLAEDCGIGESPMDVGQASVRSGGTIINLAVEYTTLPWGQ